MRGSKELIRDCLLKLDGLSDDTWEELIDKYQLDINPHELRKRSYGFSMYRDIMGEDNPEEFVKLKKEKQKISDMKAELGRQIRQVSRIEDIVEMITNECKNIEGFQLEDTPHIEFHNKNKTAIVIISDIHYDGREDIQEKFTKLINYTIDKCSLHKVSRLIVCLGGDLINNELRTTTRIENRVNVSQQITGVSKMISDGIYKLAKNVPYVCVGNIVGNHSRSIEKYSDALSTDNYLCIIKELIELRLNDVHNIIFLDNVPEDDRFCLFDIQDKTYCLMHGDGLRGIQKNAIPTVEGYLGKKIDYLLLGHFHQIQDYMHFEKRVIINGSICNEFDYSKKSLLNTPCYQRLLMTDEDGDVECIYDIKLGK